VGLDCTKPCESHLQGMCHGMTLRLGSKQAGLPFGLIQHVQPAQCAQRNIRTGCTLCSSSVGRIARSLGRTTEHFQVQQSAFVPQWLV
jgi:hypothetical protein